jgi:hypothetical protein
MGYPLWDMLSDLAVARGLRGADDDSNSRYLRGRIAAVLWIPGLAIALIAGGLTNSWLVGVACLLVTLAVMILTALGPRAIARRFRRNRT